MESPSPSASPKQQRKPQPVASFGRSMLYRVLFLLGALALIFLINMFTGYLTASAKQTAKSIVSDPNPRAPVTCDSQPMTQDQACDHQIVFSSTNQTVGAGSYTYDQQKQYQQDQRIQDAQNAQIHKWDIILWPLGILVLLLIAIVIGVAISFPVSILRYLKKRRQAKRQSLA
jgi:hypothetical protein